MKTIYEFEKGDEIVRLIPAKPLQNVFGLAVQDRSYMGQKLIFAGITNGQIYLQRTGTDARIFKDAMIDLALDLWDEGWDFWEDPENVGEHRLPSKYIEKRMETAAEGEDFELAEKLKIMLDQLRKIEENLLKND